MPPPSSFVNADTGNPNRESATVRNPPTREAKGRSKLLRRGHTLSYLGLFLFTLVLFFRPYELFESLSSLSSLAYWLAIATLLIFLPTQFALEGNLTTRPREVNLLLLLCVAGLLSIPLAINLKEAWDTFNDTFFKAVLMFIVMINVVRTERRLVRIIHLSLGVTLLLSVNAISDYRSGNFAVEGYRIKGLLGGMFGNPNDLALHLVTMVPLAVVLLIRTRNLLGKIGYGACAVLIVAANVVTYSRGGFLGLLATMVVLVWKLGRSNRISVAIFGPICLALFIALAPGGYGLRILSIFVPGLDPNGSSSSRQAILDRSVLVSLRNPMVGIGMGNFHIVSYRETVSHNAYTQVSAEMGIAALVIYIMFIIAPLKRLRRIERETYEMRRHSTFYYLAVGLQASLVGYMVSSFFASVAYQWYIYYLIGYAVCIRRMYETEQMAIGETAATKELLVENDLRDEGRAVAY